ncbi:MAG: TonB-dependent receptor [Kordiimonadaceae bacterium]|nr:TonB-dependent receptor [Kordiimonadaceae bacterium]
MKHFNTMLTSTAMALVFAVAGNGATAAEEAVTEDGASSAELLIEEVMVYGTKRSSAESAQRVPGQVAAFGARQLAARQVITLEDLSMATPNVSLDDVGTSPGVANFTIRGQGINSSIPSIDPTVGVFVDGVYMGVIYGVVTDMFDLESVEIHKGPQGVLFGRNVTGGAVLLRSARPNGETVIKGKVGIESGLQYKIGISVEGSLIEDKLAAKFAIQYKNDDGFFEHPTAGRDVGIEESYVARSTFVFTPSDTFDATVIWEHGDRQGDSAIAQNSAGGDLLSPFKHFETVIDNVGFLDLTWNQVTLETNWEVGNGQITNIFGYRDVSNSAAGDIDSTALSLFHIVSSTKQDQISNELRYNGQMTDEWELTTGLYYFKSNLVYEESRSLIFDTTRIGGGGVQDHQTWGVFVNNNVAINEDVTVQLGVRYSSEKKDAVVHPLGSCTFEQVCGSGNPDNDKWTNWTPKIGVQWAASDDVTVYTHFARSYRAGGYNFRSPLPNPKAFDPERVDSLELGMKSKWLDNRLRFNTAFFFNKLDNMQREVNLADPVVGVFQDIANTASAEVKGFEADVVFLIASNFAINASVGYLDGDYTEILVDLSGDNIIDEIDLGLELPRLTKWTTTIGFTYDIEVSSGTVTARADYAYRAPAAYTDRNHSYFNAYNMVNAGLAFEHESGNWSVSLYGKNLTNTVMLGGVTVLPFSSFGGTYFAPMKKGRRWGAELSFNF